jgi:hypothetical protein
MATAINLAQPLGTATAFSRTYDNALYTTVDELQGTIAAAVSSAVSFTGVAQKQVKSVTLVPTTAPTAADQVTLTLYSLYAQAFGTATGAASPALAGGTATSTSYNKVSIFIEQSGTAFAGLAANSPVYNPLYVQISGAKGTVVVAGPAGTNTQAGYVFPTGPTGGLSVNAGDVIVLAKGTDSVGIYQVSVETSYTPGASFTA